VECEVAVDDAGPVATCRLQSEDGRNLLGAATIAVLQTELERLADQPGCRAIIITGGPGCFSQGWAEGVRKEAATGPLVAGFTWLGELEKPVIAAVAGACWDGGLELALACDMRIAAEGATFRLGNEFPVGGGAQRLGRIAGRAAALEMLLTAAPYDSAQAARCGLISEIAADPLARALEVGAVIASRGPAGVHFAKEAVLRGSEMPLDQALRYETDLTIILQSTEERAEGVRAFIEKRPPRFTNS
jgi:enoyl-CoA hydratase/carnithine racemase